MGNFSLGYARVCDRKPFCILDASKIRRQGHYNKEATPGSQERLGFLEMWPVETPKDRLYQRVVGEVAELASREVPNRDRSGVNDSNSVFFMQIGSEGHADLWVGEGDEVSSLQAIRLTQAVADVPYDLHVKGYAIPFRVATVQLQDGSHIYLGLSEKDELRVLRNLRVRFLTLWLVIVLLGFLLVFYATWRMLRRVETIAEAASRIGQSDLSSRVANPRGKGEIGHLARTLNQIA